MNRPAAVLIGAVEAATKAAPVYGADAQRLAQGRQTLILRLGAREFARAVAEGEAMTPDAVVRYACAELRRAGSASSADGPRRTVSGANPRP